jgi:hypothetical protein
VDTHGHGWTPVYIHGHACVTLQSKHTNDIRVDPVTSIVDPNGLPMYTNY